MDTAAFIRHWHLSRDGQVTEYRFSLAGGRVLAARNVGDGWKSPRVTGDLWDAIVAFPDILKVGTGITILEWDGIDTEQFLGALRVDKPDLEDLGDEAWEAVFQSLPEEALEHLGDASGSDLDDEAWDGVWAADAHIVRRRIRLNGHPGAILVDGQRAAVISVEPGEQPIPFARPVLSYEWAREPGGPMLLAGTMEISTQSSRVYCMQWTGDLEPSRGFWWRDRSLEETVTDQINGQDWVQSFLRFHLGLPGCSPLQRRQQAATDILGEHVWVDVSRVDTDQVLALLAERNAATMLMAHVIASPDSADGRRLYDAIRMLTEPYWEGTWDDIDLLLEHIGLNPSEGGPDA